MNIYTQQIQDISNNKYTQTYIKICHTAQERANNKKLAQHMMGYIEKHHVLPKSFGLGGEMDKLNYAFLTDREHFICHKLLTFGLKQTKYYYKCLTAIAAFMYKSKAQERILSSRDYEFIRKCNSAQMKNRIPWNKGLKTGPQSKELIEKRVAPLRGTIPWNKGIPCTDEAKKKNSQSNLGRRNPPIDLKIRQKMSTEAKNRIRLTCECCGKENLMPQHYKQWHNNCQAKK